jgi:hypothetical protein
MFPSVSQRTRIFFDTSTLWSLLTSAAKIGEAVLLDPQSLKMKKSISAPPLSESARCKLVSLGLAARYCSIMNGLGSMLTPRQPASKSNLVFENRVGWKQPTST